MPQLVFNPADATSASNPTLWSPTDTVPKAVRDWGYCPDYLGWNPGDLILVSSLKPGFIGRAIRKVQQDAGYSTDDSRWEHVAVYMGSGALCEATRDGVGVGSIYQYAMDHLIRVRRDDSLSQDQRWQLTVNALTLRGFSYNFAAIAGLFWKSRTDYWRRAGSRANFPKRSFICSQLYADAYMKTCSRVLGDPKNAAEQTPASLSAASILRDVPIGWLKIG